MVKRIFSLILAVLLLLALAGCGKTKTVHCDHCGEKLAINANYNPVVSPGN